MGLQCGSPEFRGCCVPGDGVCTLGVGNAWWFARAAVGMVSTPAQSCVQLRMLVTQASDLHQLGGGGSPPPPGPFSVWLLCPLPPSASCLPCSSALGPGGGWRDWCCVSSHRGSLGRAFLTRAWLFSFAMNVKTEKTHPEDTEGRALVSVNLHLKVLSVKQQAIRERHLLARM